MKEKKYSILTYNLNNYEIIHEIPKECMNDEIEYIYVTDDDSITSDSWTVVYEHSLTGSVFDRTYQIRFNPFKYAHTDTVMRIDGSMGITRDVIEIFEYFDKGNYDAAVMIHPTRYTMYPEYCAWVQQRGYPAEQANKCLKFMTANDYDVMNYKGLYQFNFMIQRNDGFNNAWNEMNYKILKALATEPDTIERIDQTIGSFVLNKFFSDKNIMPVGQYICNGMFFNWYVHNTDRAMDCDGRNQIEPFMFNKMIYLACLY